MEPARRVVDKKRSFWFRTVRECGKGGAEVVHDRKRRKDEE